MKKIILFSLISILFVSCNQSGSNNQEDKSSENQEHPSAENNRRRGIDYDALKQKLNLSDEQHQQFDEILSKYQKISQANRANFVGADGSVDRYTMFQKMDEVRKQQALEMGMMLNPEQFSVYEKFIAKNTRTRPGYSDDLLHEIKTKLNLNDSQYQMLLAINVAFERSYHNAHDFYHGNAQLASEYWDKYDTERKNAVKQLFTEEQYSVFLDIVDDAVSSRR